jgi:hypothetical protein
LVVRVFRGLVIPGSEEAFHRRVRETALPAIRAHDGVAISQVGRRITDRGEEFVLVSVWWELDGPALEADPIELRLLGEAAGQLEEVTADLYEAFGNREDVNAPASR